MSEPMSDEEAAARHAGFQEAIAELRPVQPAGYDGGLDCPCLDDPYNGCDGTCRGA